ncbi:HD-GYP domain-containing protein [Thalassotalea agariperforans]
MISEKALKHVAIGEYIVDIVKQQGSYVLSSPGYIKNEKVLTHLKLKGVESVLIDTSKSLVVQDEIVIPPANSQAQPLILEINKAKKIFNESKALQRKIFEDALSGRDIDITPVIEITDQAIDTIFKNPDALACIINIRQKDEYLLEHSVSVSILMSIFARYLNIDKQIVRQLAVGAFLHDVGKIMIPDSVLNKPGKLTDKEFTVMKTHVNHSIKIIEQTKGISEISLEVAALHHEKLDGTGYPYQISENKITQYGRMVAICDIFDALTADRVYKDGYSHIKSFSILRKLAEQQHLDKRLVDTFIKCLGVYPVGSLVELGSKKLAIVEGRNHADPIRPKVRSFYSVDDHRYVMTQDIDLSKTEDFIVKGVRADEFDLDMNKIVEFLLMQG